MVRAELRPDVDQDLDDVKGKDPRTRHLVPFSKDDPERAAAAGRKGAVTRRATATARQKNVRATIKALDEIAGTYDRERLGTHAATVAGWLLAQIAAGQIPIRNGDEAATLLRALVDVARVEEGQALGTSVVAHIGAGATREILELRDQARRALGLGDVVDLGDQGESSALAVDDSAT